VSQPLQNVDMHLVTARAEGRPGGKSSRFRDGERRPVRPITPAGFCSKTHLWKRFGEWAEQGEICRQAVTDEKLLESAFVEIRFIESQVVP
jgi:hypothetical protein